VLVLEIANETPEPVSTRITLEDVERRGALQVPGLSKQMIKKGPLPDLPETRPQLERSPRSKGHKVQGSTAKVVQEHRQHGDSIRDGELLRARDIEAIHVLAGNVGIGADVHDINPLDVSSKVLNGTRNESARDQRLPESHLVRNQEPMCGLGIPVHAIEDIIDRCALEVLELRQHGVDVHLPRTDRCHFST
jgi:hypothetical protein